MSVGAIGRHGGSSGYNVPVRLLLSPALAVLTLAVSASAADHAVLRNGFSIRHERRDVVDGTTRLYLSAAPDAGYVEVASSEIARFERDDYTPPPPEPPAPSPNLNQLIAAAGRTHGLDADLIASVVIAESALNPRAVSPKGARGLMQLMPATASELGVKDAFDPIQNIDGGTRYLRHLLTLYNNDLARALAAYHAGPQRVAQYKGVPPYRETRRYVARVIQGFNRKKLAAKNQPAGKAAPNPTAAARTAAALAP